MSTPRQARLMIGVIMLLTTTTALAGGVEQATAEKGKTLTTQGAMIQGYPNRPRQQPYPPGKAGQADRKTLRQG